MGTLSAIHAAFGRRQPAVQAHRRRAGMLGPSGWSKLRSWQANSCDCVFQIFSLTAATRATADLGEARVGSTCSVAKRP